MTGASLVAQPANLYAWECCFEPSGQQVLISSSSHGHVTFVSYPDVHGTLEPSLAKLSTIHNWRVLAWRTRSSLRSLTLAAKHPWCWGKFRSGLGWLSFRKELRHWIGLSTKWLVRPGFPAVRDIAWNSSTVWGTCLFWDMHCLVTLCVINSFPVFAGTPFLFHVVVSTAFSLKSKTDDRLTFSTVWLTLNSSLWWQPARLSSQSLDKRHV